MTEERKRPVGRRKKYAEYDRLLDSIQPRSMSKRPKYINGIGVFRGVTGDTVWVKIRFNHPSLYKGKSFMCGQSIEIKLGKLSSFTWKQVEESYLFLQGKADRGEPLEDREIPNFDIYAMNWIEMAKTRMVHRGYSNTKSSIQKNLIPFFGGMRLDSIAVSNINVWQAQQSSKCKPATVKRQKVILSSILMTALREGIIEVNPIQSTNGIRVPEKQPRYINPKELKLLLDGAGEVRDWLSDYILWGVYSGMRQGEVRRMRWKDIHYPKGGIPYVQLLTGKTHKVRNVSCSPVMLDVLDRQKKRKTADSKRVFPYAESTLRIAWSSLRNKVGITDITIQNLRTTSATYGALSGVPLRTLAGRLGHRDTKMLEKHYAALVGSEEAQAAGQISSKISEVLQ